MSLADTNMSLPFVTLDLSCNKFSQISTSFFAQRLPQLKNLNLAHNELLNISRESFYNLLELQTLVLSHNNISDIDYETFLALPNLQYLDLSHNRLSGSAIRALQRNSGFGQPFHRLQSRCGSGDAGVRCFLEPEGVGCQWHWIVSGACSSSPIREDSQVVRQLAQG